MTRTTEPLDRILIAIDVGDMASLVRILAAEPDLANELGRHPEFREDDPWTPLVYAAFQGNAGACRALLKAGAVLNDPLSGSAALEMASGGPHQVIVNLLLEAGAAVTRPADGGWSALHHAASGGTVETAEALVARGADVEAVDDRGRRPLHLAASSRKLGVSQVLLKAGAGQDHKDEDGRTALQHVIDRTGLVPSAHSQPLRDDEKAMMNLLGRGTSSEPA